MVPIPEPGNHPLEATISISTVRARGIQRSERSHMQGAATMEAQGVHSERGQLHDVAA